MTIPYPDLEENDHKVGSFFALLKVKVNNNSYHHINYFPTAPLVCCRSIYIAWPGEGGREEGSVEWTKSYSPPPQCTQVPLHLLSPSAFYPPVAGDLLELGQLLISRDATVEDLKLMILTLPAVSPLLVVMSSTNICIMCWGLNTMMSK